MKELEVESKEAEEKAKKEEEGASSDKEDEEQMEEGDPKGESPFKRYFGDDAQYKEEEDPDYKPKAEAISASKMEGGESASSVITTSSSSSEEEDSDGEEDAKEGKMDEQ